MFKLIRQIERFFCSTSNEFYGAAVFEVHRVSADHVLVMRRLATRGAAFARCKWARMVADRDDGAFEVAIRFWAGDEHDGTLGGAGV